MNSTNFDLDTKTKTHVILSSTSVSLEVSHNGHAQPAQIRGKRLEMSSNLCNHADHMSCYPFSVVVDLIKGVRVIILIELFHMI